jgi:uncharacterized protein YndB with AHSA1/START domain
VRFERHLSHPPEKVWRALVDRDELRTWFPTDIITDEWKVGATLEFPFRNNEGPTVTGTVLELDEPRVLAYTWGDDTIRFELSPGPTGGTDLVLTDELDGAIAARNAAGWEICLEHLAGHGPGDDGPGDHSPGEHSPGDNAWKPLFDQYVAAFEPTLGPQEGPPHGLG